MALVAVLAVSLIEMPAVGIGETGAHALSRRNTQRARLSVSNFSAHSIFDGIVLARRVLFVCFCFFCTRIVCLCDQFRCHICFMLFSLIGILFGFATETFLFWKLWKHLESSILHLFSMQGVVLFVPRVYFRRGRSPDGDAEACAFRFFFSFFFRALSQYVRAKRLAFNIAFTCRSPICVRVSHGGIQESRDWPDCGRARSHGTLFNFMGSKSDVTPGSLCGPDSPSWIFLSFRCARVQQRRRRRLGRAFLSASSAIQERLSTQDLGANRI